MKKIVLPLLLWTGILPAFSQKTENLLTSPDLQKISHNLRVTGWSLAGGGSALFVAGSIMLSNAETDFSLSNNEYQRNSTIGGVMMIAGLAAIISSIPLFISSSRKHRQAVKLTFTDKNLPPLISVGLYHGAYPALRLTITLGK